MMQAALASVSREDAGGGRWDSRSPAVTRSGRSTIGYGPRRVVVGGGRAAGVVIINAGGGVFRRRKPFTKDMPGLYSIRAKGPKGSVGSWVWSPLVCFECAGHVSSANRSQAVSAVPPGCHID
jgi:hypothetical protein